MANGHGGARKGAGRKPRTPDKIYRPDEKTADTVIAVTEAEIKYLSQRELRRLCRQEATKAMHRLRMLFEESKNETIVLRACQEVLRRAMGPISAYGETDVFESR